MKDYGKYCSQVFDLFFEAGEVTEIRAFGLDGRRQGVWEGFAGGGIVYGYFDNADDFGRAAGALDKTKTEGVYFVLNPVDPALLARANNRLKGAGRKSRTTSDLEVVCLRWLYIDLDPIRHVGISSNQTELEKALEVKEEIRPWLIERRFFTQEEIIGGMSGNGGHLLCFLPDWPNDQEHVGRLKIMLAGIEKEFGGRGVDIDQAVFNPARLCKVYGTVGRKGDSIKTRPHRRSYLDAWVVGGANSHFGRV